jgi:hypothetical protein
MQIDGPKLARWFLKTLINLSYDRGHPIGRDSGISGRPSDRLVRIAYGLETFSGLAGLHMVAAVGTDHHFRDEVAFANVVRDGVHAEAGCFFFHGMIVLLCLEAQGPPHPLTGLTLHGVDLGTAHIKFHLEHVNWDVKGYRSHSIDFRWS